ncbi:putative ribonuclease H-like domain-containing protein [Tanacetum coccineum]
MCDKKNSVLFNDIECIVLSPNFKLTDESHVLLKVPRKNNVYSVDLKNIGPKGGLTCLFAKATSNESKLWHRRLGHINFKTMNKLDKGNLVRGLPSKLFENDQTCVACQKGKQHRASSTKDETSGILKSFIIGVENLINQRVKVITYDNGTKFKNKEMNQFCERKDDDEDIGAEADMNSLNTFMPASPIPTTRIHKDHPVEQIIRDLNSAPQTRRMTKNLEEHGRMKAGIMIKEQSLRRLVAMGTHKKKGLAMMKSFAMLLRTEAIRLFLAYASFKNFVVYQMDVKSDFFYGKIKEEVYVCQPSGFEDPDFPDRVYKVEKALYGLDQALRAWYETLSTYLLDNGF